MLTDDQISALCLGAGFKVKQQEDGSFKLNDYVFVAARAIEEAVIKDIRGGAKELAEAFSDSEDRVSELESEVDLARNALQLAHQHLSRVSDVYLESGIHDVIKKALDAKWSASAPVVLKSYEYSALVDAVDEAAIWRGTMVGDPDPEPLKAFDEWITFCRNVLKRIKGHRLVMIKQSSIDEDDHKILSRILGISKSMLGNQQSAEIRDLLSAATRIINRLKP